MIDRSHQVIATQVSISVAAGFDLALVDAHLLMDEIGSAFPPGSPLVSLSVQSERLVLELLSAASSPNLMVEVPASLAADPAHFALLQARARNGIKLALRGRPPAPLPDAVRGCFRFALISVDEDRRRGTSAPWTGSPRDLSVVQCGAASWEQVQDSFSRGAAAILGWPKFPAARRLDLAGLLPLVELIRMAGSGEPLGDLEQAFRRDPRLAFRLLRFLGAPGSGVQSGVTSIHQAIELLGAARLRRWLVLEVAAYCEAATQLPLVFQALRRGLIMEELAALDQRRSAVSASADDLFVCGALSATAGVLGDSGAEILRQAATAAGVEQALLQRSGPLRPYLDLAEAYESGRAGILVVRDLSISRAGIGQALLRALARAAEYS